jgi:O-antigen/teichoic acid export membrane protein
VNNDQIAELESGHGPTRNTFFSLVAQGAGAVFTIVLTLFLVRVLGPAQYGVLALAVSVGTLALLISDLGISTSAARFTAEKPHDRMHAANVLRTALVLKLVTSIATAVALVILAPFIADAYRAPSLTLPLQLMAVSMVAQGLGALFLAWFTALGRISLNLRYALVESSVETAATISLVLISGGAAAAVAGRTIGFATGGVLAVAIAIRVLGWPAARRARADRSLARRIVGYGAALLIVDSAFAIFDRTDVLIIGAVLGPASAGIFEAAFRVLTFLVYPGIAVGAGFGPRLAAGRRSDHDSASFLDALRYTILFYLLLAAPVLVWATPIVQLVVGGAYEDSSSVLRALAPTVVLAGIGPVLASGANYLGEARKRVPIAIGALLLNVAIDIVLVPRIGIVAGAIGTGAAFALYIGGHVRICQRALGISFARLGPSVARGFVAFALAALVLFAMGTGSLSVAAWLIGPVVATAAYLGSLVLLKELDMSDVRTAARLVRLPLQRDRATTAANPS